MRSSDIRRALADPDPLRRRQVLHDLFYTPAWPYGPEKSALLGDSTMTPKESGAHLRASARHDAWDGLSEIAVPTLVLHGTDDLTVPADNATALTSRIPNVALHLHEGGRHGFFEEFADSVTPVVRAFLG